VQTVETPIDAKVRPPGSKSITIRALAAAAMADGRSHLYGPLVADDTTAMTGALRGLGIDINEGPEPWAVDGKGGHVQSMDGVIDVNESGLTARIVLMMAAFSETSTTVTGRGRLLQRPIDSIVEVLGGQGVSVQTTNGFLPATVNGQGGLWGGDIDVDCSKSSQFGTAVLLAAPLMSEPTRVRLSGLEGSGGYLDTTLMVMSAFGAQVDRTITGFETVPQGYAPADFPIEPDASAAVYPLVAAAITGGRVEIEGLNLDSTQPDISIARHLESMGCQMSDVDGDLVLVGPEQLDPLDADLSGAPDGALGLAIACAFARGPSRLAGLHSLRYKESDRLDALASELGKVGVQTEIEDDELVISPGRMGGGVIDPHGDHRIAMSLAIAGLRVEGVEVANPSVVNKTWPDFWSELARISRKSA
jgi:3-phosphoshikimate 1-carboxyvinyltransferase